MVNCIGTHIPLPVNQSKLKKCNIPLLLFNNMGYPTGHLYFLVRYTVEPLGECVYQENTSDKWDIP